jgi:Cd2+/Zn2+-exporting ATPase
METDGDATETVKGYPSIRLLGLFGVTDQIREHSRSTMQALQEAGIRHLYMLTGDHKGTAEAISRQLGDGVDYRAELMPEEKAKTVEDLMKKHGYVAMVGDGVNDAPALATATVGIAMGTAGTDTALETADIALMADDLSKLPYTVKLSRNTLNIIKQNIAFSLLIKAIFLLMIIPGWVTLWMAVTADVGASILVILNGMRLLRSHSK